jgi:ribosome biogenesis GTPase
MSKRKLSDQQKSRIQKNQQARIHQASNSGSDDESTLGPEQHGLVTARYSRHVDIKALEGERCGQHLRCHIRANLDAIAVGDKAIWRENSQGEGVVVAVEERRSLIERPDGLGKLKPVAANIDQVFLVFAAAPEPHPTLIDRYLIAAENSHIEAKLVFNKIDLLDGANPVQALIDTYRGLGYEVFETSCNEQLGIEAIRQALAGKTSVFAGQSGVGKSSLINALLPGVNTKVGTLSDAVSKGRHTTTTASLYELPGDGQTSGGYLIDSPGIREFHLNHYSAEQIYAGYRELQKVLGHCQFRDCKHLQEPNCAVKNLLASGAMQTSRVESLQFILHSLNG